MNTFLKISLIIAVVIAIFSTIGLLIPDRLTSSMTDSITYFLNFINYLKPLLDVSVVFNSIQILFNFFLGVALFKMLRWITRIFVQ